MLSEATEYTVCICDESIYYRLCTSPARANGSTIRPVAPCNVNAVEGSTEGLAYAGELAERELVSTCSSGINSDIARELPRVEITSSLLDLMCAD